MSNIFAYSPKELNAVKPDGGDGGRSVRCRRRRGTLALLGSTCTSAAATRSRGEKAKKL